ncbi:hypothetical protein HCUR_01284 [Holospora curviuscula]|uniref:Uncharacterized protein n=1 Tax=Holospora curviuscula TaxID=1082868 RepID=A0A2S5R7L1_9PROT|nr:hypothetical protein HCUR_01284 [Holospora curviuscula]
MIPEESLQTSKYTASVLEALKEIPTIIQDLEI